MKIGIISDTHGSIPAEVFTIFQDVSQIIHAGDIGDENVLIELRALAPVSAVYGNIDTFPVVRLVQAKTNLIVDNLKFHIVHDIGSIKQYCYMLFREKVTADVVIYGHTHRASIETFKHTLFCNPGSVSRPRFGAKKSVAIIDTDLDPLQPQIVFLP